MSTLVAKPVLCTVAAELIQVAPGPLGSPVHQKVYQYTFQPQAADNDASVVIPQPLTIVLREPGSFVVGTRYYLTIDAPELDRESEN